MYLTRATWIQSYFRTKEKHKTHHNEPPKTTSLRQFVTTGALMSFTTLHVLRQDSHYTHVQCSLSRSIS